MVASAISHVKTDVIKLHRVVVYEVRVLLGENPQLHPKFADSWKLDRDLSYTSCRSTRILDFQPNQCCST